MQLLPTADDRAPEVYLNERRLPLDELSKELRRIREFDEQGEFLFSLSVLPETDSAAVSAVLKAVHDAGFKPRQFAFEIHGEFGREELQRIAQAAGARQLEAYVASLRERADVEIRTANLEKNP